jgi:hypothetical protein
MKRLIGTFAVLSVITVSALAQEKRAVPEAPGHPVTILALPMPATIWISHSSTDDSLGELAKATSFTWAEAVQTVSGSTASISASRRPILSCAAAGCGIPIRS